MSRLCACMLTAVLLLLGGAVAAQTSADHSTRDALDAIDSVTPSTQAAPTSNGPPAADRAIDWLPLITLFAPALVVATAIGISGSVIGSFVLLREEGLLALSLPQVVAAGAAIGLRFGWPTLPPALVAVIVALIYLTAARRRSEGRHVSLVPTLYIGGLSLAFLAVAHSGQHVEELQNLFTGIDVAVTPKEMWLATPILLIAAAIVAALWRRWLLIAQQRSAAELSGLRVARWDALFLCLLALIVLIGTATQGLILVLAMIFLPPAIAYPWARRIPTLLGISCVISILCVAGAFVLSNAGSLPLSHSLGGIGFGLLLASQVLRRAADWRSKGLHR